MEETEKYHENWQAMYDVEQTSFCGGYLGISIWKGVVGP